MAAMSMALRMLEGLPGIAVALVGTCMSLSLALTSIMVTSTPLPALDCLYALYRALNGWIDILRVIGGAFRPLKAPADYGKWFCDEPSCWTDFILLESAAIALFFTYARALASIFVLLRLLERWNTREFDRNEAAQGFSSLGRYDD